MIPFTFVSKSAFILGTLVALSGAAAAQYSYDPVLDSLRDLPAEQAEICVLGTFHFKDAGLDAYQPKFDLDIMSEEGQNQVGELLDLLEHFAPTKIAVEMDRERQPRLDGLYSAYLKVEKELSSNEIYQLGFRLGKRLNHSKLYAIDADRQTLYDALTDERWQAKRDSAQTYGLPSDNWDARYMRLYSADDSLKQYHSLRETLLYMNTERRLTAGHGHYLVGFFQMGTEDEYTGPNASIGWYVRNLRIFQNLIRITESPDDRILLIIGAGHAPIINHAIDSSPQYRLVPVSEVLDK